MIARQVRIDLLVRLAEVDRVVAAVGLGQLLLDDVGFDRDTEMIRLAGEIRGEVVVGFLRLERRVSQIAPEHGEHPELVRMLEHLGHFLELPLRFFRAEVNRRADAGRAHVEALLHAREADLVEGVRVRDELVVVDLEDERNLVRVLAGAHAEHAERGATALQPPSTASLTMFSGSKYCGFGANDAPAECSMP
jgi:hypothetical protein